MGDRTARATNDWQNKSRYKKQTQTRTRHITRAQASLQEQPHANTGKHQVRSSWPAQAMVNRINHEDIWQEQPVLRANGRINKNDKSQTPPPVSQRDLESSEPKWPSVSQNNGGSQGSQAKYEAE